MNSSPDDLIARNPFPGLRAFAEGEGDIFFGREQQITDVAARLADVPLVAVAGSSGCGKSSLVLAGLLAHLARRRDAGGGIEWRPVVLRPGNRPILNLAAALLKALHPERGDAAEGRRALYGMLRLGGLGLVEAVRAARLDPQVRMLVVVDQFEEIFRFKHMTDPDQAVAFVKLLLNAASNPAAPISVVLTTRSNALGDCGEFRDLPEAVSRGLYLVPRLTREQRKEAIVKPVELRGYAVENALVQRVINDVSDDFNDLPVMQHVLCRTWRVWAADCHGTRPITLEDYDKTGRAKGALSQHANEALESLEDRRLQLITEKVFRALTERVHAAEHDIENRRPMEFERLCQVIGGGGATGDEVPTEIRSQIETVIDRFRRADTPFLLPPATTPLKDNPVIDITHESLIRLWPQLQVWAQAESAAKGMLLRLRQDARLFENGQGDPLATHILERALEWQRETNPTASWINLYSRGDGLAELRSINRFLAQSAEDTNRRHRREQRNLWLIRGSIAAFGMVALAAALSFRSLQLRTSSQLTNEALLELTDNPARSVQWALAALDSGGGNERAEFALRQATAMLDTARVERIEQMDAPVHDVRLSTDGTILVVAAGTQVVLFDRQSSIDSNANWHRVSPAFLADDDIRQAWLLANNTVLLTWTGKRRAQAVWVNDRSNPYEIACESRDTSVYTLAVSPDDRHLAVACVNGELSSWTVDQRPPVLEARWTPHRGTTITSLRFSADGSYMAAGAANGQISIWREGKREPIIAANESAKLLSPVSQSKAIRDISFHPLDHNWLVTAGDDNDARVWKLDLDAEGIPSHTGRLVRKWRLPHIRPVESVSFLDLSLATTSSIPMVVTAADKDALFWRLPECRPDNGDDECTAEIINRGSHLDWIRTITHSTGGLGRTLTTSADQTARIWGEHGDQLAVLPGHRDEVVRALFTGNDEVVTASLDHTLRVWSVTLPETVVLSDQWILTAVADPSGKRLAVGGEGTAALFKIEDPTFTKLLDLESVADADQIQDISWDRQGKIIAARWTRYELVGDTSAIVLWDAATGKQLRPDWLTRDILTAEFGSGTDELLTVSRTGELAIWNTSALLDEAPVAHPLGTIKGAWSGAISSDGRWIAAIGGPHGNETITLTDRYVSVGAPQTLTGHRGQVRSIRFSPDSKRLVSSSNDRTAIIWSFLEPSCPRVELKGHLGGVTMASFSRDGQFVTTGSMDGTVRVWAASTGHALATMYWHREGVNDVQFTRDRIISASDDGIVRMGSCESCPLTLQELANRAPSLSVLPKDELERLRAEILVAKVPRSVARFWSWFQHARPAM